MFSEWLNRFAEKKENAGEFVVTTEEKVLFLRIFERPFRPAYHERHGDATGEQAPIL